MVLLGQKFPESWHVAHYNPAKQLRCRAFFMRLLLRAYTRLLVLHCSMKE